jgi:hypothetical protein
VTWVKSGGNWDLGDSGAVVNGAADSLELSYGGQGHRYYATPMRGNVWMGSPTEYAIQSFGES